MWIYDRYDFSRTYEMIDDEEYHQSKRRAASRVRYLEQYFDLESWEALEEAAEEIYSEQKQREKNESNNK